MKKAQKMIASALAFVFILMLAGNWPAAGAEDNFSLANRYNVVLVMDKSGSLRNVNGVGTDPDGLRYDAMRLFLGLLTEKGNNVGVVAFDEAIRCDTGLKAIDSMEDKKALVEAVEVLGTSYDTDIGSAVLRATEILKGMREKNGLPCEILLLTDGMTDFTTDSRATILMERSRAAAQKALETAQEEEITIHGILLNVEGRARNGEQEIRFFTDGTGGQIETVSSPADLTATFKRFYSIINRTEYDSAHRIAFPAEGEVKTGFTVPGMGAEEVNLVIECAGASVDPSSIRVTAPDGSDYDVEGHLLETARFLLVKIPEPMAGDWSVALRGEPGDSIDVCMIYNASMCVTLRSEPAGRTLEVLKPIRFAAELRDTDGSVTDERLDNLACRLSVKDLSTGEVTDYPMTRENDSCVCELTFDRGGNYVITAAVDLIGFELLSNALPLTVEVPLPQAKLGAVSDYTQLGSLRDGIWELDLNSLFEDPKGGALSFALSGETGEAVTLEGGVLRADLRALGEEASFTVLATDSYGQTVALPFAFAIDLPAEAEEIAEPLAEAADIAAFPAAEEAIAEAEEPEEVFEPPTAKLPEVGSIRGLGQVRDNVWEIDLSALFDDPSGEGLRFALDDPSGAAAIEGGILRVKLGEPAVFTVTATDSRGLSTTIPFTLNPSLPQAKTDTITDPLSAGQLEGRVWEIALAELFESADGGALTYAVSDDLGGAVTIEDGVLRADLAALGGAADFTLSATDPDGLRTELPIALRLPAPAAAENALDLGAGEIRDNVWSLPLEKFFDDPSGAGLRYTLSDDFGGAVRIENGVLYAELEKLGENAAFTVTATDAFGQSTELPVSLSAAFPAAKAEQISDVLTNGRFVEDRWEIELDGLFDDPDGAGLRYTLSDDLGGALTIEDGVLKLRPDGSESAEFSVTATDAAGLSTTLPFSLRFPAPAAKSQGLTDTVKTGLFQKGSWEQRLTELFEDPKGTALTYTLSDDYKGAIRIEGETLQADCGGLGEAAFTVKATDSLGLSAELPVKLIEKNVTWIFLVIALLVVLLLVALLLVRSRRRAKKR